MIPLGTTISPSPFCLDVVGAVHRFPLYLKALAWQYNHRGDEDVGSL